MRVEIRAMKDTGHRDAVFGAGFLRDGAQMRLVGAGHVDELHIQMPFRHRHVAGLAGHKPAVVQGGKHVGQLHQIFEVGDGPISPSAFQIADEGRAIDRGENLPSLTNDDVASRVAGDLGEASRRFRAKRPHQIGGRPHRHAVDLGARRGPAGERGGVFAELDPVFLAEPVGLRLKPRKRVLVAIFEMRDGAGDIGWRGGGRDPRVTAASASSCFHHRFAPSGIGQTFAIRLSQRL